MFRLDTVIISSISCIWIRSNFILIGMALFLLVILMMVSDLSFSEGLNDPMRPSDATESVSSLQGGTVSAWNLTATLISGDRRLATLNGQLVAVGDWVDGARVSAISSDSVKLVLAGKTLSVSLNVHPLRKPAKPERRQATRSRNP